MEEKINQAIENNRKWPIIIENVNPQDIDNAIIIDSKIPAKD